MCPSFGLHCSQTVGPTSWRDLCDGAVERTNFLIIISAKLIKCYFATTFKGNVIMYLLGLPLMKTKLFDFNTPSLSKT